MAIAEGDTKRAKVIWRKLQIKRHFPMTFNEALYPATFTGNTLLPAPPGSLLAQLAADPGMQPITVFTKNLASPFINSTYVAGSSPQAEMGALLLLTLTVNRRGTKPFNAGETLGPQAVADTTADLNPPFNIGLPQIVDGWGNSLAFFRFPTDNLDMDSAKPGNPSLDPRRDPQDPEGTLINVNWNNPTSFNKQGGVYYFEVMCHRVHDSNLPQWAVAYYMQPTIVSAGPNKRLGILLAPTVPPPFTPWQPQYTPPYFTPGPPMTGSPNFGMYPDMSDPKNNPVAGPPNSYIDDIFSYSLR
jgi:hypothetical protein